MMADANISKSELLSVKIQELAGVLESQTTNFGVQRKITTSEWLFNQEMYPIEDFSLDKANAYVKEWENATSSTVAKGRLIWLYVNRDTASECLEKTQEVIKVFENKPIVVMLLNDIDNRMFDSLVEYTVLDNMDDAIRKKYDRHYIEDITRAENNLKDEVDSLKKQRQHLLANGVEKLTQRMPIYLTSVFEEIYPNAIPFFFDGFVTKNNNIGNKAAGYYCSFLKMLLSNSVSEVTIHNFVVDMRNRVEALFSTSSFTSWKCINERYKLIPPEEPNSKRVYDDIVNSILSKKEVACKEIYSKYCKPPYGMSEDVVTLMIAVVCSNLSYCLRIRYQKMININLWKDSVVTNNDKKVDLKVIKNSILVYVDADAVTGKYMRFFDKIKNNRSINEVNRLSMQLQEMVEVDEVPEELESMYLLARKTLDSGKKARNAWSSAISGVEEKFDDAQESNNLYNALVALENLKGISFNQIFDDNGYEYDKESQAYVQKLSKEITVFIGQIIDYYVSNMYCKTVEGINTFRNHNTKIETKLRDLGFIDFSGMVQEKKEAELNNIEEIRSRQELRVDYEKYMQDNNINRFTSYVSICSMLKDGLELQARVEKYKAVLGKDSINIVSALSTKLEELSRTKERINRDMSDVWDDLYEVNCSEDIEDLIERITIILQRGISSADQSDFSELKDNLQVLLDDINLVKEATKSRKRFAEISEDMRKKYMESDFDFEVLPILEDVIEEIAKKLDVQEEKWKKRYLTLGDKSRRNVHEWKESIKNLPAYLSESTIEDIKRLENEANEIIRDGKIEDVIFYFEKLDSEERKICIEKLVSIIK